MAKGWDGIEQQAAATAEARARFAEGFKPELKVNPRNPGPYIIRFLEQGPDVNNFPVHEYKVPDQSVAGGFRHRRFTCLAEVGQQCPGCSAGMKVKRRGVYNVIQRNRPVFRKDKDGKAIYVNNEPIVDGYEDTVVIANVGGPTAEMLRKLDGKMGGLMSRDWELVYSGDSFQAWNITPVTDGAGNAMATPMSEADFKLAAEKHDLDAYMKPPDFQEAARIVAQFGGNSGAQTTAPGAPQGGPQGQPAIPGAENNRFMQQGVAAPAAPVNTFGGGQADAPAPEAASAATPTPAQG